MKKILATVLAAVLLCALLCGCGGDRAEDGVVLPSGSPMISPSMTLRPEDGAVNDRDGFIGDGDDRIGEAQTSPEIGADSAAGDVTGNTGNTGTASSGSAANSGSAGSTGSAR